MSVDERARQEFTAEYGTSLAPVAVIMAAYREEGSIGDVVSAIPATVCGLSTCTIVVVDGSDDETAAVARKHGALVCDVPVNRGQGAALRLGYSLARATDASFIVTIDADGQYDPAEIARVLSLFDVAKRHAHRVKPQALEPKVHWRQSASPARQS